MQNARRDFPLLLKAENLVYLDSGATAQKPSCVINAEIGHYLNCNAPTGRSLYPLATDATERVEVARERIANFIGASTSASLVFTTGTTMAINIVAYAWARQNLKAGDVVLTTMLEHHANIVPWLMLKEEIGIDLQFVRLNRHDAVLNLEDLHEKLKNGRVKLVCVSHVSNVTATLNPVNAITSMAHEFGAAVLVDGAQSTGHMPVNVAELGCDFFAFSGHKMLGPMGTGALYVNPSRFSEMGPMFGGGDMISRVTTTQAWFRPMPTLLEAGTQNVAGIIALATACNYLDGLPGGLFAVDQYIYRLGKYAWNKLMDIPNIKLLGPGPGSDSTMSLVSFTFDHDDALNRSRISNEALATKLGERNICVRSGLFCAHPLLNDYFRLPFGATRASFHVYNTMEDVDRLIEAVLAITKDSNPRTRGDC